MKKIMLFFLSTLLILLSNCKTNVDNGKNDKGDTTRIAIQAWSFNRFSFCETLGKLKQLGVNNLEAYNGQQIGGGKDGKFHYTMNDELKNFVQDTLKKAGIKVVNYGVVSCDSIHQWRMLFDFAKSMGIETITSEPNPQHMDTVEALAIEYGIRVAIHNHPAPSHYWSPDSVNKAIEGRSEEFIGACVDNGHWTRSGLDIMESLHKLNGRIKAIHFKDLPELNDMKAETVPYGTGKIDLKAILNHLKEKNFDGVITIEYESNWDNNMDDVLKCVDYLRVN